MKVGRNDPCPCGSGKKYKKCCLPADEAKMPAAVEPPHPKRAPGQPAAPLMPPPPPKPPVDPEQAAIDQALEERSEQFEAADLEGKIAMYLRLVEGEGDPPMDREDAVEMLSELLPLLAESNQRARFDQLIDALREKQPEVYEDARTRCLEWSIYNRAAQGQWGDLAQPVKELAALGGEDIDTLRRVMDMLDFHGRLPLLVETARIAWPKVKESEDVVAWGVDEFAERASLYEIYDYLEQHPDASAHDEPLLQRLRPYADGEPKWPADYLANLNRPVPGPAPLDPADFDLKHRKRRHRDEDENARAGQESEAGPDRALVDLSVTFLGWMRRAKKVAWTRGEVGRREMVHFLSYRAEGELDDRRSMVDRMMHPKQKPPKQPIEHPLCPDRIRFDAYLSKLLSILSWHSHHAAALMHIAPLWLEFLELNGLLTPEQRWKMVKDLSHLLDLMRDVLSHDDDDPRLIDALNTWPK